MNERIKKLLEQAGIELPNNLVEGVNGLGVVSPEVKFEKFAELIVRECAGVMQENVNLNYDYCLDQKILKHFGVEE